MIPEGVRKQEAAARQAPESMRAQLLIGSKRKARAEVWCTRRHRLAWVYEAGGQTVLAVPGVRERDAFLYRDAPADSGAEHIYAPWSYDLEDTKGDDVPIALRCHCGQSSTTVAKVRRQVAALRPGDRRIYASRTVGAYERDFEREQEFERNSGDSH